MKSKINGWGKVFGFTFEQTIKSKTTIITTVVLFLAALLGLPASGMLENLLHGENSDRPYAYEKVYIEDQTNLQLGLDDFSGMDKIDKRYGDVAFVTGSVGEDADTAKDDAKKKKEPALQLTIQYAEETGFLLHTTYWKNSDVSETDARDFAMDAQDFFEGSIIEHLKMDEDTLAYINMPVKSKVVTTDADGKIKKKAKGTGISEGEYAFAYILLFVLMICIAIAGEGVASAIVVEKANRVVEYLLTAVEPMAIVLGKVLASLAVVVLQFMIAAAGFGLSVLFCAVTNREEITSQVMEKADVLLKSDVLVQTTPLTVLIAIACMLLGFFFYGMLAGLAGATVSKIEDTAEGIRLFSLVMVIGVYLALAVVLMGLNSGGIRTLEYVAYLLPISSPFILPAYVWMGKVSIGIALASLFILIVSVVLEVYFVSAIYGNLIFYNGSRLKIKDLWKMFVAQRPAGKKRVAAGESKDRE